MALEGAFLKDGKSNPPNGLPNAIVVDGRLVATPVVDPDQNPNGIDAPLRRQRDQRRQQVRSRSDRARGAVRLPADQVHRHLLQQHPRPTLGKDSLRNGLIAGAAGLLFVMIFLLIFYGFLGVIADIALIIYGMLLAGVVLA